MQPVDISIYNFERQTGRIRSNTKLAKALPRLQTCRRRPGFHGQMMWLRSTSYKEDCISLLLDLHGSAKWALPSRQAFALIFPFSRLQVTIPVAKTADGPVGLSLIGCKGSDKALLTLAVELVDIL